MLKLAIGVAGFLATTGTALAGTRYNVPGPEVGAGLASLALLSVGVAWLRKRHKG